ncbi:MAG: transglycosylase SLT domain-containing protein [Thermodesulfovibrionales bacterium]|nr:transglycosylase SLT domain-containing protein [Thermodesulfovibrionales bacterium]
MGKYTIATGKMPFSNATLSLAETSPFRYHKGMKHLLFIALFLLFSASACAEETGGKASLQKGKKAFDNGRYEEAISSLSLAGEEFPLLGDYALLWLAEAYNENKNHRESLNAIRSLLKKYPESPLSKKARCMEISKSAELSEDRTGDLFETYLSDYAGDMEMKYFYAKWLKKQGKIQAAKPLFKDIYIRAGAFAIQAYSELSPEEISTGDMLQRGSNLNDRLDFTDAESLLRTALSQDDGTLKDEILKKLGVSLFRQKKYREAADIYRKAGEKYWEVRSLYRARDKEAVYALIDEMMTMKDPRFASLLLAVAADKRRAGNIKESLDLYEHVLESFPRSREDTLWGIGWTYYLSGEYAKSAEIFTKLHSINDDPQYLYWKARSIESAGEDTADLYPRQIPEKRDFYSLLSFVRTKKLWQDAAANTRHKFRKPSMPAKASPDSFKELGRVEVLLEFGLNREAVSELIHLSKHTGSLEEFISLCSKFEELDEYKHSVRLAAKKSPSSEQLYGFLYPLAYWDTVISLSERYHVDPFLVLSLIREESRFDAEAKSPAGALGLMQLMPQTAYRLDKTVHLKIQSNRDIYHVRNNLHLGISYLSQLIQEFGSYPHAIAAYNAGEETVRKWAANGQYKQVDEFIEDIPYTETRNYVKRVLTTFFEYNRLFFPAEERPDESLEKL